LTLTESLA